ncbi:sensor histidine kinase [Roseobacteraceae bacterium S113]
MNRFANSVRLRLLILALAPLVLLLPLLLFLGMTRWTGDYDDLLISKVESDLRIAEQYLARIMADTGDDLVSLASSVAFAEALEASDSLRSSFFSERREELALDFLYYLPNGTTTQWPVIAAARDGRARTEIDIFSAADLAAIDDSLRARARITLIETEAAVPTEREVEDRGMVVHAASPVAEGGVLVGGILLNRNLTFIDTINALVYQDAHRSAEAQGTATLFLEDVRISTNVRLFEDVRALGTRVSAVVRGSVLDEGQTWLDRAFVVNDWYISGYLPITDSFGARVGMLYVGFLEAPFATAKRQAIWWMGGAFALVLLISVPVFLRMARGVFAPLERMTDTMRRVRRGDLSARNAHEGRRDDLGQVADHLDDLLDQVQESDLRLRAWADELNASVESRTAELREANVKLEETYRQLVMSEKLASIGEITAGVAHEINNPVAVIQGNMDVVRATLGDETGPIETELDLVDNQVTRIRAIVGKLLQFARPGEFASDTETVALRPVVEDCLVLVDHVLKRGALTVETALDDVPAVRIDKGEVQQVIINLIMNAAQAMGRDGTLFLALGPRATHGLDGIELEVRDTGPGIPDDQIDNVFDPFFTTKQAEGTGLGLSISQTIVQRAGGRIRVENGPRGGACFRVWLPVQNARIAPEMAAGA